MHSCIVLMILQEVVVDLDRDYVLNRLKSRSMTIEEFNFEKLSAPPLTSLIYPTEIADLYHIAKSVKYSAKPETKLKMMNQILNRRGFMRSNTGTNRTTYKFMEDNNFLLKVAYDDVGRFDNPAEFRNQMYFKPYVTKIFEVDQSGTLALIEKVIPITNRAQYMAIIDDVFYLITEILDTGEFVIADIGTKYFMNIGIREGFGPVLLDFPYVFPLDGKKLYCNKPDPFSRTGTCDGQIDHDTGYNQFICTKCGKIYRAKELGKDLEGKSIILKGDRSMKLKLRMSGGSLGNKVREVKSDDNMMKTVKNIPNKPIKNTAPKQEEEVENKKVNGVDEAKPEPEIELIRPEYKNEQVETINATETNPVIVEEPEKRREMKFSVTLDIWNRKKAFSGIYYPDDKKVSRNEILEERDCPAITDFIDKMIMSNFTGVYEGGNLDITKFDTVDVIKESEYMYVENILGVDVYEFYKQVYTIYYIDGSTTSRQVITPKKILNTEEEREFLKYIGYDLNYLKDHEFMAKFYNDQEEEEEVEEVVVEQEIPVTVSYESEPIVVDEEPITKEEPVEDEKELRPAIDFHSDEEVDNAKEDIMNILNQVEEKIPLLELGEMDEVYEKIKSIIPKIKLNPTEWSNKINSTEYDEKQNKVIIKTTVTCDDQDNEFTFMIDPVIKEVEKEVVKEPELSLYEKAFNSMNQAIDLFSDVEEEDEFYGFLKNQKLLDFIKDNYRYRLDNMDITGNMIKFDIGMYDVNDEENILIQTLDTARIIVPKDYFIILTNNEYQGMVKAIEANKPKETPDVIDDSDAMIVEDDVIYLNAVHKLVTTSDGEHVAVLLIDDTKGGYLSAKKSIIAINRINNRNYGDLKIVSRTWFENLEDDRKNEMKEEQPNTEKAINGV